MICASRNPEFLIEAAAIIHEYPNTNTVITVEYNGVWYDCCFGKCIFSIVKSDEWYTRSDICEISTSLIGTHNVHGYQKYNRITLLNPLIHEYANYWDDNTSKNNRVNIKELCIKDEFEVYLMESDLIVRQYEFSTALLSSPCDIKKHYSSFSLSLNELNYEDLYNILKLV